MSGMRFRPPSLVANPKPPTKPLRLVVHDWGQFGMFTVQGWLGSKKVGYIDVRPIRDKDEHTAARREFGTHPAWTVENAFLKSEDFKHRGYGTQMYLGGFAEAVRRSSGMPIVVGSARSMRGFVGTSASAQKVWDRLRLEYPSHPTYAVLLFGPENIEPWMLPAKRLDQWGEVITSGQPATTTASPYVANPMAWLSPAMYATVELQGRDLEIHIREPGKSKAHSPGHIHLTPVSVPGGRVWEVVNSGARKGYGPILYDIAMEIVSGPMGELGITPDTSGQVSTEASDVWRYYFERRQDVEHYPLRREALSTDDLHRSVWLQNYYRTNAFPVLDRLLRAGQLRSSTFTF